MAGNAVALAPCNADAYYNRGLLAAMAAPSICALRGEAAGAGFVGGKPGQSYDTF